MDIPLTADELRALADAVARSDDRLLTSELLLSAMVRQLVTPLVTKLLTREATDIKEQYLTDADVRQTILDAMAAIPKK